MRHAYPLAASALILARFATLPLYSFNQEYGYLEAYYSILATTLSGLAPTLWDSPITNTPPLYVWLLAGWSQLFGSSDMSLRLPSLLAWVLASFPIRKMGGSLAGLAWLSFPLSFTLAGRVMPDMVLACLLAYALQAAYARQPGRFTTYTVLAVLVKPHALLILLVPLGLGLWAWLEAWSLVLTFAAVGAMNTGYGLTAVQHFLGRWPGYWDLSGWFTACLGGSLLGLAAIASPPRGRGLLPVWSLLAGLTLFALYAMPDFGYHEYYWLPALAPLAVLSGHALRGRSWIVWPAIAFLVLNLGATGDLWDSRTAQMPPADSAEPGLGFVATWYGNHAQPVESVPTGTYWGWAERVEGCVPASTWKAPMGLEKPLYVHECF